MNSFKIIFIALIALKAFSGWGMGVGELTALFQKAEQCATECNGAEIYKMFAEVFVDGKMYETFESGIYYRATYNAAENKIEGSSTRNGISMSFTLRQNGHIEGRDYFNILCRTQLEEHQQVAQSLSMSILLKAKDPCVLAFP